MVYTTMYGESQIYGYEKEVPENREVWGFAFRVNNGKYGFQGGNICKPVLGVVKINRFYEYKKGTKQLKKSSVLKDARCYADTEIEAITEYNKHILTACAVLDNYKYKYKAEMV